MAQMAFGVVGEGYGGWSVGAIKLYLRYNGNLFMYESAHILGGGGGTACLMSRGPIDIPDDPLLQNFAGQTVQFKLDGTQAWGPVEMTFNIYFNNRNDAVYTVVRRPQVDGFVAGGVNYLNTFRQSPVMPYQSRMFVVRWLTESGLNRQNAEEALRPR